MSRNFNMPTKIAQQQYFTRYSEGTPSQLWTPVLSNWSYNYVKVGVSNPKWRSQVKQHQNATTPYTRDDTKHVLLNRAVGEAVQYGLTSAAPLIYRSLNGSIWVHQNPTLAPVGNVGKEAALRFLLKCKRTQREFSGFQFLGELRETVHALRHPIQSLKAGFSEYLSAIRKDAPKVARRARRPRLNIPEIDVDLSDRGVLHLPKRKPRRVPSTPATRRAALSHMISGSYLEYANGWRPLANEIEGLAQSLSRLMFENHVWYKPVYAKSMRQDSDPSQEGILDSINGFSYRRLHQEDREVSVRIKGEIRYELGDTAPYQSIGLGWLDFGATLWELLPLSYVADWFLPIGDLLEASSFNMSDLAWAVQNTRQKSVVRQTCKPVPPVFGGPPYLYQSWSLNPGARNIVRNAFSRGIPDLKLPSLMTVHLPEAFLLSKLCNVSSLALQARATSKQISRFFNG